MQEKKLVVYLIGIVHIRRCDAIPAEHLEPASVKKSSSPWNGTTGGLDFLVNANYFKGMIKKYCSLEGPGDSSFDVAIMKIVALTYTEMDKLTIIANSVANQSASQWQADVRSRKMTIVNGTGIVHGISYNLSDYGIGDGIVIIK